MAVFIIILSILLWLAALAALLRRQIAAPALGYLGLLCLSSRKTATSHSSPSRRPSFGDGSP